MSGYHLGNEDDITRQLSKQEETLLKRKKEIERKLSNQCLQQLGNDDARLATTANEENQTSSGFSNQFANDGSFLEQFRKVSSTSSSSSFKDDSWETKQMPPALKNIVKSEPFVEPDGLAQAGKEGITPSSVEDPIKSEWFQDALKRAREKAKSVLPQRCEEVQPMTDAETDDPKARKTRWGQPVQSASALKPPVVLQGVGGQTSFSMPGQVMNLVGPGQHMEAIQGIMISKLTRDNPAIIAYANKVFGTLDLTDSQWKQCEEQMKMNIVFQLLKAKKKEADRLEQLGKVKYEYDSDEDIDGGTWEHKRRKKEMAETAKKSESLTREGEGKHHIGDYLPPEELSAFVEKYQALKDGRDPDMSDYRDNKLTEDNIGYKMLKSMGWTEGSGLGAQGKGITAPIVQKASGDNQGLGVAAANHLNVDDDEYDAYRKRMMLAYRFRPNPLNNPRRAYY